VSRLIIGVAASPFPLFFFVVWRLIRHVDECTFAPTLCSVPSLLLPTGGHRFDGPSLTAFVPVLRYSVQKNGHLNPATTWPLWGACSSPNTLTKVYKNDQETPVLDTWLYGGRHLTAIIPSTLVSVT